MRRSTFVIIAAAWISLGLSGYALWILGEPPAPLRNISFSSALQPFLESLEPTSGTIGTEIVIRGSGFDIHNNDIAFSHPQINFQGSHTAYLNSVPSPDGKTLRFTLPDVLGACAFSQMRPGEACPSIGLGLPSGTITVSVVNRHGWSNGLVFERVQSELEKAEELIYQSPDYKELWKILNEIVRRTGGFVSTGIHQRGGKIFIVVWIERDLPSLSRKIPAQIAGFEVWLQRGWMTFGACAAGPDEIFDDAEILRVITAWVEGRDFEGCGIPTDDELLTAIDLWVRGAPG